MRQSDLLLCLAFLLAPATAGADPLALHSPPADANTRIVRLEDRREFGTDLLRLLLGEDPLLRRRAALAAGRIGVTEAIEPLASLLHDPDPAIRETAAFALGEIEDSTAAIPLLAFEYGEPDGSPRVRAAAIEALGKLRARGAGPACRTALADSSVAVQGAACLASWRIRSAETVDPLLGLTAAVDPDLRWKATYALVRMLGAPVSGRTPTPGGTDLSETQRDRIREALLERISDADPRIRIAAARGLRDRTAAVTAGLIGACADDDWRVRVEAVTSLAAAFARPSDPPLDFSGILELASDPNPNARAAALQALGLISLSEDPEPLLQSRFESGSTSERRIAAAALAARWSTLPDRVRHLAQTLAESSEWTLRVAAAEILQSAEIDDPALIDRLRDDDPRVAKMVVGAYLRNPERTPGEIDALLDAPDPILRALSIETLGEIRSETGRRSHDAAWQARLLRSWRRARSDAGNDVALAVLAQVDADPPPGSAALILEEAAGSDEPRIRREALRLLAQRGAPPPAGLAPEVGRSLQEYASILRWAAQDHLVDVITDRGTIRLLLFARDAPLTCWNFTRLAESGFYDGGLWHRVVPNFVIQDGCPRGDGWGGPGIEIRCEINRHPFETGTIGMALSGKDTGGSQFFITHSPQPHLDGRYTVFGRVLTGLEVVDQVEPGDRILRIRIVGDDPRTTTDPRR